MRTKVTLRPGQKGTRKLLEIYGKQLVCVRYRYDPETRRSLKTAEIIVQEKPWIHCPRFTPEAPPSAVRVHLGLAERELRDRVKQAGGIWDAERRLWTLEREAVRRLDLDSRIVHGTGHYIS